MSLLQVLFRRRLNITALRSIELCEFFLDKALRVAGPVLIALAAVLISAVVYIYFSVLLFANVGTPFHSFKALAHVALGLSLLFNLVFNYAYCVITPPGHPPSLDRTSGSASDIEGQNESADSDDEGEYAPGQTRWCRRCRRAKPALTHHCHVCGKCILKMDHHCPWLDNCVGFFNYRYFLLFITYLWLGCIYVLLMTIQPLFRAEDPEKPLSTVVFAFTLCFAVAIALGCLLAWHLFLILTAQTTVEFHVNRQRRADARKAGQVWSNEFNLGPIRNFKNTLDVQGPFWWCVWLLPRLRPPKGDGCLFPVRGESSQPAVSPPLVSVGSQRHLYKVLP
ncbi:DHHC-type zinc finger family protein [Klebsormidium nitens]|uniref:S-acyltransferase n=1 Tax=Klebsormidium nitens TaxID=105231 RepID=A0A1Y1I331_KLENI|nr:DHHC-type zinc finger family protein [Klebsormidium nitens]|eukprot:GAQ83591.1 DHHC-type zinc finger family protein [Klebsormidium nitens]